MVVLERTWLFRNLIKLLIDMSTPKRWSGSGFSTSPPPSVFWEAPSCAGFYDEERWNDNDEL
jgi:hypothetical protein